MVAATFLGLLFVPLFFVVVKRLFARWQARGVPAQPDRQAV
jgi:hypothetical protein